MEEREQRRFPRSVKLLEALVAVVATLGELVATATAERLLAAPDSPAGTALRRFTRRLERTLDHHGGATSPGLHGVPSLSQALPALVANPAALWARGYVAAVAGAWLASADAAEDGWVGLAEEAAKLRHAWEEEEEEEEEEKEEEAPAPPKGQPDEATPRLLRRLAAACDEAAAFPRELRERLEEIRSAALLTREVTAEFCLALAAAAASAERLGAGGACLARHHLLGALADAAGALPTSRWRRWRAWLRGVLGGRTVAERCRKAAEDVPRLLRQERCRRCDAAGSER